MYSLSLFQHYVKGPNVNDLIKVIFLLCWRISGSGKSQVNVKWKIPMTVHTKSFWQFNQSQFQSVYEKTLDYIFWKDRKRAEPDPTSPPPPKPWACFSHYSLMLPLLKSFFPVTSLPQDDSTRLGRKKQAEVPSSQTNRNSHSKASALTSEQLWGRWAPIISGLITTSGEEKAWEKRRQGLN